VKSPLLVGHLRRYVLGWKPNLLGLLFVSSNGRLWDIDTVRRLYPYLRNLGSSDADSTLFVMAMQPSCIKSKYRWLRAKNRLGQSDARTTMGYTHAMSEDGRRFAAAPRANADSWRCLNFGPNWTSIVCGWKPK
jgi:hypothetical protein